MTVHKQAFITLTQAELVDEARRRFGDDPLDYAFACPNCGDAAKIRDFVEAAGDPSRAGQECIGRTLGALKSGDNEAWNRQGGRGCDWVAYGLFPGPWGIVMPPEGDKSERTAWGFPLAGDPASDGPVARKLAEAAAALEPAVRERVAGELAGDGGPLAG